MTGKRYDGAAVLISGAARGFGKLAAQQFAEEGARLVLTDILADALEDTAAGLRAAGAEVVSVPGDIASEDMAQSLVTACVSHYGRLDVAVNNAGVAHKNAKLADLDAEILRRVMSINVDAVFFGMKYQLRQMEKQKSGVVLNLSSVAGINGAATLSIYAASKHAVIGLTKSAAAEYARSGIRINALCPSFTSTPMVTDMLPDLRGSPSEALVRLVNLIPMRRLGRPEEIVQAMIWICSPENSFMTGHALALDGGLTAV